MTSHVELCLQLRDSNPRPHSSREEYIYGCFYGSLKGSGSDFRFIRNKSRHARRIRIEERVRITACCNAIVPLPLSLSLFHLRFPSSHEISTSFSRHSLRSFPFLVRRYSRRVIIGPISLITMSQSIECACMIASGELQADDELIRVLSTTSPARSDPSSRNFVDRTYGARCSTSRVEVTLILSNIIRAEREF